MNWTAKWIWAAGAKPSDYNDTIRAVRTVRLGAVRSASLHISADSAYRLHVNGRWVCDGPSRSWTHAHRYDVVELAPYLIDGENRIEIIARYFGSGSMHRRPMHPGLLAELIADGKSVLATDKGWTISRLPYRRNVPRIALQMEPLEIIDADRPESRSAPAVEYFSVDAAPWKNLTERDVALLTLQPFPFRTHLWSAVVRREWMGYNFSLIRKFHPGLMEADGFTCMGSVAVARLESKRAQPIHVESYPKGYGPRIVINGAGDSTGDGKGTGTFSLRKGTNFVAVVFEPWGHHNKEQGIRFVETEGLTLLNAIDEKRNHPWEMVAVKDIEYHENDFRLRDWGDAERAAVRERVAKEIAEWEPALRSAEDFIRLLGDRIIPAPEEGHCSEDPHWQLECRELVSGAEPKIENPAALMTDTPDLTVIHPNRAGDIELCYDLGEQNVGYYQFELEATAGTQIDLHSIEYIRPDGVLQHTEWNRNGMRLVCSQGWNRLTSLKRRSGRYVILTIRRQTAPVRIRLMRLVESTYPVQWRGRFACSDAMLEQVWQISARTLKLCMEDSFTDCPLYEQTLWVGDARNEALFAQTLFGAEDLSARCIRMAAESLELYPIITCVAPTSTADAMLPAWAFLWGFHLRDHWRHTGDKELLRQHWPAVLKNIRGATSHLDSRGLFSGAFWNMFDWSGADQGQRTVVHNTLLLIGCIDAAIEVGQAIGKGKDIEKLAVTRASLTDAVNRTWQGERGAYPDSFHDNGQPSPSSCVHTHFLAVLFDVVPKRLRSRAIANAITPPEGMVQVGSPFAMQYYYEMLEKIERPELIFDSIREKYLPMIRSGATTVWEQFAGGNAFNPSGFPTRSHTHAWSSAPLHFLHRHILGIQPTGIGGVSYAISPRVDQVEWAEGVSAGVRGDVAVRWRREGTKLTIEASAPQEVELTLVRNPSMKGLRVEFRRVAASSLVFHPQPQEQSPSKAKSKSSAAKAASS